MVRLSDCLDMTMLNIEVTQKYKSLYRLKEEAFISFLFKKISF